MKYKNGHEFEFQALRPSQIKCDPFYQRKLDTRRVEEIVRHFNGDLFNEPKVSYRDGQYWVFNGQHTIAAWKRLHNGEDKFIFCKVFKGMTWLEECDAFIQQNGIAKDPTTNDKLKALYEAKDPDVVAMVNGATLCGYVVDFSTSKATHRIVATSALFKAFKSLGNDLYVDMLTAIREAWYGDMDAICAQMISGMASFYKTYFGNFNRSELVRSLSREKPIEILRNGKNYRNRSNTYTREIVRCYNFKRKHRLDDGLL